MSQKRKQFFFLIPFSVVKSNIMNTIPVPHCHILKGFVGKCDGCGENFTSSNLIWNAVKNWKAKLDNNDISNYFILDQILPLSRERIDCLAMRYSYDMEYFNRFKCNEMEKILKSIILFRYSDRLKSGLLSGFSQELRPESVRYFYLHERLRRH